jgi:hypothetical protein
MVRASQRFQPLMLALSSAFFFELKPSVDLPTCLPLASDFACQRNLPRLSPQISSLGLPFLTPLLARKLARLALTIRLFRGCEIGR